MAKIKDGEWDFSDFYIKPKKVNSIVEEEAEKLRIQNIYRTIIGGFTAQVAALPRRHSRYSLSYKESGGIFKINGMDININKNALDLSGDDTKDRYQINIISSEANKLESKIIETMPEAKIDIKYLTSVSLIIDDSGNSLDLDIAAFLDVLGYENNNNNEDNISAIIFPLNNRNFKIYQISTTEKVFGSGIIYQESDKMKIKELLEFKL